MRKILVFLIAMTLGAAVPAAAQMPDAAMPCEAPCPMDCCDGGAGAADCAVAHCMGAVSVVLPTAALECARVVCVSDAVLAALAPLVALPGRAPDTAPPKPFV
jgi:hypothetical protein